MANFIENIFAQLLRAGSHVVLREVHGEEFVSVTGGELLRQVQRVRVFLRSTGLGAGDRCALLASNSIRWAAFDLAMMAEGIIVVPLYVRQAPGELAAMMRDCQPALLFTSDAQLGEAVADAWSDPQGRTNAPPRLLLDDVLGTQTNVGQAGVPQEVAQDGAVSLNPRADADLVTIIYTSGTSGEPKGVCLNVANVTYMLSCTA